MTWEDLCRWNCVPDSDWPAQIRAARDIKNGAAAASFTPSEVTSTSSLEVEVGRSFRVMSEKEIRQASNLPRVNKAHLKGVPTLTVPAEDGSGNEVVYCFKDQAVPWRIATVKVKLQESKTDTSMPMDKQYWAGQAAAYLSHAQQNMSQASGVNQCLDKDANNFLFTWDDFLAKRLGPKKPAQDSQGDGSAGAGGFNDVGGADADDEEDDDEGTVGLVGAAASAPALPHSASKAATPRAQATTDVPPGFATPTKQTSAAHPHDDQASLPEGSRVPGGSGMQPGGVHGTSSGSIADSDSHMEGTPADDGLLQGRWV